MTTIAHARPETEFDPDYPHMVDAYRHEDGSITYIVLDEDGEHANPRDNAGNVVTLVQRNDRCMDLDEPEDRLAEARGRWAHRKDTRHLVERYVAMFRPDILLYEEYWEASNSYGWAYVTADAWDKAMMPADFTPTSEWLTKWLDEDGTHVRAAFDIELSLFRQWANGEVYGAINVHPTDKDDECWGFLGYDDHREIAAQVCSSPITEELA
jgi:hypothetical protein